MRYAVKEIFYTLQGEGANSGRPAVLCRFAGCNLWSGREEDRPAAICTFCDTDFVGTNGPHGGRFDSAVKLAEAVARLWPAAIAPRVLPSGMGEPACWNPDETLPLVVCTGGEPLLQLDDALVSGLHKQGFIVAVETNGTCKPPPGIDWICVSPKAGTDLIVRAGNELKLIFPQAGGEPERFEHLDFHHFFLQPMDGPAHAHNIQLAVRYCLEHPRWRLSLQMHKLLGLS